MQRVVTGSASSVKIEPNHIGNDENEFHTGSVRLRLTMKATGAVDKQGTAGNWAAVLQKTRGGKGRKRRGKSTFLDF